MEGYNPVLAFSSHLPGTRPQESISRTPTKKFNFTMQKPVLDQGGDLIRTPQKLKYSQKDSSNNTKIKPIDQAKAQQDYGSKLFNSNHAMSPKFNPQNASASRLQLQDKSLLRLPPRAAKQRKRSENNITFESRLAKNIEKKEIVKSNLAEKERRGSCTNIWLKNFSQKTIKQPRLSMADRQQIDNLAEKKVKKVRRGFEENNQFSMEEHPFEEETNTSQVHQQNREVKTKYNKQRKYSDNSCTKKPPSFLTSTRGIESRHISLTPRNKMGIERFKILRELGNGAYGRVVLAMQKQSKFICAIKILSKKELKQENMVEQFIREIKTQCFFNHPNIVKVYGYFDDMLHLYIIMECALDQRLSDLLKGNKLAENQGASVFYQLCSAISQLHASLVIHRDLKPENVMIHEGVVKLCDFGWSVYMGSQLRTTFCGTPLYLSPEILIGDSYDESVDIWALGIILYEMVVGQGPFKITRSEELTKIIHQKIDLDESSLSTELRSMIEACLRKNSLDRPSAKWLLNHEWTRRGMPQQCKRFSNQSDL